MRGMTILRPLPIQQVVTGHGTGSEFLLSPDPKEVWVAGSANPVAINVDLGAQREIDTVFLNLVNPSATALWSLHATTSLVGDNPIELIPQSPLTPKACGILPASVSTRYLQFGLFQGLNASPLQAGVLLVGKRIEHPYEYKSGRRPIDLSERIDLVGGGFGFGEGARKAAFRFTLADLSDAQVDALWDEFMAIGNRHPALLIEGGEGAIAQRQIHYCVFERFEAFERSDAADTRWALSVIDWV